ncbi:MAG: DUF3810 domain-containing protein [Clostridiaceae bacterium]|jgi:hypothetical protein|nr:DUF3810 domain-containing protein [Clostridiaceae bacterium]
MNTNNLHNRKTIKTKKSHKWKLLFLLFIPLAILIRKLMAESPDFAEMYYSRGIYKFIMQPVSVITGLVPFSFAELAVVALIIYILVRLIYLIIKAFSVGKASVFIPFITNIIMVGSLCYFIQATIWNLNYERLPFSENIDLKIEESSIDELEALCKWHIDKTNELREQVSEDETGVMQMDGGYKSIFARAQAGFVTLEKQYPFLEGKYGRPKPVLLSRVMSHLNFTGVYSCLTGEANINVDAPQMGIPSTTMHEMAHQRGIAREDEANYVAYIACMAHPDIDFKYSGSSMALQYCMNALYAEDPDRYFNLIEYYSNEYRRDIESRSAYWQQFQGETQKIANKINDTYLKLNGQTDGVKSYGRMVDLLMAEYKQNIEEYR